MLLGDSNGVRFTPFVVFKIKPSIHPAIVKENNEKRCDFGTRTWPEIKKLKAETGLQIYANGKGWWNSDLTVRFLQFHFGDRTSHAEPVLLLWDDFSGHWTAEVLAYAASIRVVLLKVPPHATSVCQPADVARNHPFKTWLRRFWLEDIQRQLAQPRDAQDKFKLTPPGRSGMCRWVLASWDSLSPEAIANGYKKCDLQLNDDCLAAASLVSELQQLSLVGPVAKAVDQTQDFDREVILEEAVV
ncbi:hypothetical protein PR002_g25291 [Phytophthora rubi]|nr:hypothetical protein PR002_g25291 [Phytophthora rubi]